MAWWVLQKPGGLPRAPGVLGFTVVEAADRAAAQQQAGPEGKVAAGPFSTRAEALAAEGKLDAGGTPQAPGATGFSIPNPLHGVDELAGAVTGFFRVITDAALWRSLGWLLLGLALMVMGLVLWLRKSGVIPDVVPVPV